MFPIFPCNHLKIPLITGWQQAATTDAAQIALWQELYRDRLTHWGIPTGKGTGIIVLDVDTGAKDGVNGFDTLPTLQLPPTLSQRTRSGGLHMIYKRPADEKNYSNRVKFLPGLDIRADGGYICYYGFDQTAIADAPQWLLDYSQSATYSHQGSVIQVSPSIAEGIITRSLEAIREAPDGESNNVLNVEAFRVGQLVASKSITREYAEQVLFQAAKERGKPDYEAKATIASALNGGQKKPMVSPFGGAEPVALITIPPPPVSERYTPNYFTTFDLTNKTKLRKPQLFENWSTEDIHITTADGGTGKTTLKLFEAICLALGERFLGFNCKQPGKTLFITGEDTAAKLGAMIGAITQQMGIFENSTKLNTILSSIVVKKDSDLCIISKDRQGFLHPNEQAMNKILEAVQDIRPKMIVFDPISSFWGSEAALNDMAKAVGKFMNRLVDESHACVEMINHMGKQSSNAKDMTQFAGRGGTGLPSNARVSRVLRSVFVDEYMETTGLEMNQNESALMCNINKFTDGSPLCNEPFLIMRQGYLFLPRMIEKSKVKEEQELTDQERVYNFILESQGSRRYPTKPVVVGHFMNGADMSEARIKRAIELLLFTGFNGRFVKQIENPDVLNRDRVLMITDADGKEI